MREKRAWHVVAFAERKEWTRKALDGVVREMKEFPLGREKIPVEVWGCVLPYQVWSR